MTKKYVYLFQEGNATMRALLGGKGANLAEMTNLGLPVPPGLTISTEACNDYFAAGGQLPAGLTEELRQRLQELEANSGKTFGGAENPLLVSVRSGAQISMPGMMDTILNLGLNDVTKAALAAATDNPRFACDCYRRFIQMFGDVAMGIPHALFEKILNSVKEKAGKTADADLTAAELEEIIAAYQALYLEKTGRAFPQDPYEQLILAVEAVFRSWNSERAIVYRQLNAIPDDLGTAVNVQSMVFGNMGENSGTGVAFTRNPSTGEHKLYGEFLYNAQGEDVVAGIRTPLPIARMAEGLPEAFRRFTEITQILEESYRDMQDIEFTVENGRLFILQTRNGKRTAAAAVKVAVDLVREGRISKEEALLRVDPAQIEQLLHPSIDPAAKVEAIATGLNASPGTGVGHFYLTAEAVKEHSAMGEKVILVRDETTPNDIHGMYVAEGMLTCRGGMTSHAAVVARGMGKAAVCGCSSLKIDMEKRQISFGDTVLNEGDVISIDGSTGRVIVGAVPTVRFSLDAEFAQLLSWADEAASMQVRANADTPEDSQRARELGAQGIGLVRTEHMFMPQDRLPVVRRMIMAETEEARDAALAELLPMQESDFYAILKVMDGLPVTIRLLDPPLHEFLPNPRDVLVELTTLKCTGGDAAEIARLEELLRHIDELSEHNPMMGHRGCRLAITNPSIYAMQVRAICQAAARLTKEGFHPVPEIEFPLICHVNEIRFLRLMAEEIAAKVREESGVDFVYSIGTMIELPRAAVTADEIAEYADFFSFGTNDLTQTSFGFSRDDAEGKFLPAYLERKVLPADPFVNMDPVGLTRLIRLAAEGGRGTKASLQLGICGEHGGDPASIALCQELGLDFVSCSPMRVPVARLAAAQAAVKAAQN